ncbi:MAG: VWA domain-containing protein [Bacteroidia bacterium]
MNLQSQTDNIFAGFVQFGDWMDADTRKALARLLVHHLYDPAWNATHALNTLKLKQKAPVWGQALDQLLQAEGLRKLTTHNEALTLSVARHAIDWIRNTHQQAQTESPSRKGILTLQIWKQQLTVSASDWLTLIEDLKKEYPDKARAWRFFQTKISDEDGRKQILLRQNILEEWETLLNQEQEGFTEDFVDTSFQRFEEDLRHRYNLLNQLGDFLAPFTYMLGDNDMHLADSWNAMPWTDIESYVNLLEKDQNLQSLLDALGRWQSAEDDIREAALAELPLQSAWKPQPYGRSEIIGIHQSDRIESVLPAELALLSHPETEVLLALKYVEKKLLTFQHRSVEKSPTPMIQPIDEGAAAKGPIIMCVDTSGSMFGQPELVAKAIAFALTSKALEENRPCFLISFSTDYKSLELTKLKGSLANLISFIRMSFHGGTDIKPALEEALRILKEDNFKDADVLVISDFILPRVPKAMIEDVQEQRNEFGTRFHSLYISRRIDPRMVPVSIFDHQWVYNLNQAGGLQSTAAQVHDWLS